MLNLSVIRNMAQKERARIGIGQEEKSDPVAGSCEKAESQMLARVAIYSSPDELVDALSSGEIDGAVRGTLSARTTMDILKTRFTETNLQRIALLANKDGGVVLLAPVGVTEGEGAEEKKALAVFGRNLLAKFGEGIFVAVLSGGRLEDRGRNPRVDESLRMGELLTKELKALGLSAEHHGILLEKALPGSNFVMAPDGITGNLIFRSLHFFGGFNSIGAPVSNIPRVFVDTSRAKTDYTDSIALASALCGLYCVK